MAFTDTQENLTGLNIHKLSLAAYQYLADNNQLDEDAIYLIEDDGGFDTEINSTSENAPQTKAVYAALENKAPAYTYGTTDLTAGVSELPTGQLYFVYEE